MLGVLMRETFVIKQDDINDLAKKVMDVLSGMRTTNAKVVHLGGDLGAGKTTFTKELASLIGIEKEEVNSPTFILKKEYKTVHPQFRKLIHIDAYRFATPEEGKVLKIEEDLDDMYNLIAIEWPGKMQPIKPDVEVHFSVIDDDTREVTFAHDQK